MPCSVPILLLTFNRPEQTRQVMAQILEAAPSKLYVHCDGPREWVSADVEKVNEVRQIVADLAPPATELHTLFREQNRGLRRGVFDALNWFFEKEEYGIILEDDCIPDPSMFRFCEELLFRYKDDRRIMHIGCSNLAMASTKTALASFVFSRFSFVWGWASWRRAWKQMSIDLDGLDDFIRQGEIRHLIQDKQAQAYMLDKFKATRDGKMNSWAYAWFYSILKNNGLCIVPKINLVHNRGVGEEGATNTTSRNPLAAQGAQPLRFPLIFPAEPRIDPDLEARFFYTSQKSRLRLRLWYLLKSAGIR